MKLVRSLSRRVVLIAVASGLVGVLIALVEARSGVRRGLALAVLEQYDDEVAQRCAAHPEGFLLRGLGQARTYAYDTRTGSSQNPAAPALDEDLRRALPAAPKSVVWADRLGAGRILIRAAAAGPCGILQVAWPGHIVLDEGLHIVGWAIGAAASTAALLGLLLVVRPLGRRTAALRDAAARLGVDGEHEGKLPASGDELDLVLAGLVAADARIRADSARLAQRGRALERHLGDVAHDVRTPLSAMQLLIEQAADAGDRETGRELLGSALRECVYLSGLTENLRLMSLLEDGWAPRVAAEPVDLRPVVERISARARALARRRGVDVELAVPDDPVEARCDPVAFERALTNIVDNAVAYGDKGGHVAVTLTGAREGFLVRILDDGPGVSPADLPRLAERAFRADSARRRDPRNTGLGLAITAELSARCGFELRFERIEPRGLLVSLRGGAPSPGRIG